MQTINIREARKQLSELIDAAQRGESIIITRRGKKVARLEPLAADSGVCLPDLEAFRSSVRIKGAPLSRTVIEERRKARY